MLVPGLRPAGEPPPRVIVPDLPEKLAWKMVDGVKEFHLYCRHTRREFLPDLYIDVWGFNDSMPGPTIEVDQGDRVRIWVHNELPESTGIHWHGLEVPIAMDGVPGLTQPPLRPARRRRSSSPSIKRAPSSTTRTTECRTGWGWSGSL